MWTNFSEIFHREIINLLNMVDPINDRPFGRQLRHKRRHKPRPRSNIQNPFSDYNFVNEMFKCVSMHSWSWYRSIPADREGVIGVWVLLSGRVPSVLAIVFVSTHQLLIKKILSINNHKCIMNSLIHDTFILYTLNEFC